MPPKKRAPAKPANPGFPAHPIYDTLAAEGFDPLMDLGEPFDLAATIAQSYRNHAPSHIPGYSGHKGSPSEVLAAIDVTP